MDTPPPVHFDCVEATRQKIKDAWWFVRTKASRSTSRPFIGKKYPRPAVTLVLWLPHLFRLELHYGVYFNPSTQFRNSIDSKTRHFIHKLEHGPVKVLWENNTSPPGSARGLERGWRSCNYALCMATGNECDIKRHHTVLIRRFPEKILSFLKVKIVLWRPPSGPLHSTPIIMETHT